jgi:hypothetical protein
VFIKKYFFCERDYPEIGKIGVSADAEPEWINDFFLQAVRASLTKVFIQGNY